MWWMNIISSFSQSMSRLFEEWRRYLIQQSFRRELTNLLGKLLLFFGGVCDVFLAPPPLPGVHRFGSVPGLVCARLHLKFPAFKGVTHIIITHSGKSWG